MYIGFEETHNSQALKDFVVGEGEMDVLLVLLLSMSASMSAATSINHSTWKPYSDTYHHEDDHQYLMYSQNHLQKGSFMSGGLTSLQPGSYYSERMVEEGQFILSSMHADDKSDLNALLSI